MASLSTSIDSNGPPLGKCLASTDKTTRDKAIKNLARLLSGPSGAEMSKSDLGKLWKGIFYCFWMSDKPLVQQALATELSEIMLKIDSISSALNFLEGFWQCIVREWSGIDRLRIDKYYMLIRRYVNASFRLLMREEWDIKHIDRYNDILSRQGGPLCLADARVPSSLAYHLCDIYLEELNKVLAGTSKDDAVPPSAPLARLMQPFFDLAAHTTTKHTLQRIISSVFEPLIESLARPRYIESPGHKRRRVFDEDFSALVDHACLHDWGTERQLEKTVVHEGIIKLIFDTAGDPSSRDSNRRKLYSFWKQHAPDLNGQDATSTAYRDPDAT